MSFEAFHKLIPASKVSPQPRSPQICQVFFPDVLERIINRLYKQGITVLTFMSMARQLLTRIHSRRGPKCFK